METSRESGFMHSREANMIAVVSVALDTGSFEDSELRRSGNTSRSHVAMRFAGSG